MRAYVDESGCTGKKFDSGSTLFFCVTAVLFRREDDAARCDARIGQLRQELRVAKEFHFSKCNHDVRVRFFTEMLAFDFVYFGLAIDKLKFMVAGLDFDEAFLQAPVVAIFTAAQSKIANATVVIDKTGSSEFRHSLAKNLRGDVNRQIGRDVIARVKHQASHSDNLLQLADMTCGAVARSVCKEKANATFYRNLIREKELFITLFPSA
jgi:hypothetical protein